MSCKLVFVHMKKKNLYLFSYYVREGKGGGGVVSFFLRAPLKIEVDNTILMYLFKHFLSLKRTLSKYS